jgi:hypothetical protein
MYDPNSGSARQARALAEQALHAQAEGNADEADRLFAQAQQLDPDAVAVVLNEHDAALAPPDARDSPTANHGIEKVWRVEADPDPAAYPGSTGAESMAKLMFFGPKHPQS